MSFGLSMLIIIILFIIALGIPLGVRLFQYNYVKRKYIAARDEEISKLKAMYKNCKEKGKEKECLEIQMKILDLETEKQTWRTLAWHVPRGY